MAGLHRQRRGPVRPHEGIRACPPSTGSWRLSEAWRPTGRGARSSGNGREGWHGVHAPVDEVMMVLGRAANDIDFACHEAPARLLDLAIW